MEFGFGTQLHVSILRLKTFSVSHIAEELSRLLEQPHQAALREVPSRTHPVFIRGQDVIRHR